MGLRYFWARRAVATAAAAVFVLGVAGCAVLRGGISSAQDVASITVTSSEFRAGGKLPREYSCEGTKGSPPLRWSSQPLPRAKTFAIVVDDSSSSDPAVHWVIYNIDRRTTELGPGVSEDPPDGWTAMQAVLPGGKGKPGYVPPCPKSDGKPGNYRFSVYALRDEVKVSEGAPLSEILQKIADLTIARGRLTAVDIE
ncbi:YbhB/YbcL family Raf kinase inhibitor-like protein [Thermoactinospora rubra]|uniref:YbhB/YbcL family Raf kinase inhibitor-like protein n=1 Tax=Thermoactinospora rubra TaxID=1088767 RepID=UPI000A0FC02B|nr:YbhB/YbcL family Raf kinase inhibitor-like protein [Thermoactinospora rubra]